MIVVATDAPLSIAISSGWPRARSSVSARTGSSMGNGSGDYVIAFSTAPRRAPQVRRDQRLATPSSANDEMSALFQAAAEATEEAIYNSLFMATTVSATSGTVEAIPVPEVVRILKGRGVLAR